MSFAILFATNSPNYSKALVELCGELYPEVAAYLPEDEGAQKATVAACWAPQQDLLACYPNLQLVHSVGAGVDHIPEDILLSSTPVCRVVDDGQKWAMFEYALYGILHVQRNFDKAVMEQASQNWQRYPIKTASSVRVGILGMGELGGFVAQQLAQFGYSTMGWSRSEKRLDEVACFYGEDGLAQMLPQTDVLINLLPLNQHTQGILNWDLMAQLPKGAYLINCGRGGHLVASDLIAAIEQEHLRGALLDVFPVEPLPSSDPLWQTKGVIITPHVASDASKSEIIHQLVRNGKRLANGQSPLNQIDSKRGY
ncbi:glyoxylate/hydroxypyruvate reductase A [Marinomonas sp. THO17]|uniref:2-hydroxyacid dehydrogenase n=1 Tax=Marinomonas sp. THO17 TaxID=3149048 RepID=UPI00336BE5FE